MSDRAESRYKQKLKQDSAPPPPSDPQTSEEAVTEPKELTNGNGKCSIEEHARDLRNEVLHSATFEMEEGRLTIIINTFQDVLRDKKSLVNEAEAINAIDNLEKIRQNQIFISFQSIEELRKAAIETINEEKEVALVDFDNRRRKHEQEIEQTTTKSLQSIEKKGSEMKTQLEKLCEKKPKLQVERSIQTNESDGKLSELGKRDLQKYLIEQYRSGYMTTDLSPLKPEEEVDVEKLFVPLTFRRKVGDSKAENVESLKSIFFCDDDLASNIYITGDAGMGKTTLCKKLIADWCKAHTMSRNSSLSNQESELEESDSDDTEHNADTQKYEDSKDFNVKMNETFDCPNFENLAKDFDVDDNEFLYTFEVSDDSSDNDDIFPKLDNTASNNSANACMLNVMKRFEFLFFVSLRDTYQERCIEDMVVSQLLRKECFKEQLKLLVSTEPQKCLFILDGLDEWVPPVPLPTHPTVTRGLPISNGEGTVIKLFTSRPWKVEKLRPKLKSRDVEITLLGIKTRSSEQLARLVFDQIAIDKDQVDINTVLFLQQVNIKQMTSLISVPLLVKLLVCHWERNNGMEETQTAIFSAFLRSLCSVGFDRNECDDRFNDLVSGMNKTDLPTCLEKYSDCRRLSAVLGSLGKLAFESLFSAESSLVFSKEDLYCHGMSETQYELCLKMGLLSRKKVTAYSKLSSSGLITFIHKTFQEYFAALYITMNFRVDERMKEVLGKTCSSTQNVEERSKIFDFVKEMDPSLMCEITQHMIIKEPDFNIFVNNDELKVNVKMNNSNKNVMNCFMTNSLRSITISSSNLGKHVPQFPAEMTELNAIALDAVGMTPLALKTMIESIPGGRDGVSLKLCNISLDSVNTKHTVKIFCRNLKMLEISFMNISDLKFHFSSQTMSLKSVVLRMITSTEELLEEILRNLMQTPQEVSVIFDSITLGKSMIPNMTTRSKPMKLCDELSKHGFIEREIRFINLRLVDRSLYLIKVIFSVFSGSSNDLKALLSGDENRVFWDEFRLHFDTYVEISNIDIGDRIIRIEDSEIPWMIREIRTLQFRHVQMADKTFCALFQSRAINFEINIYTGPCPKLNDSKYFDLKTVRLNFENLFLTFSLNSERKVMLQNVKSLTLARVNLHDTLITFTTCEYLKSLSLLDVTMTEDSLCTMFMRSYNEKFNISVMIDNIVLTFTSNSERYFWCNYKRVTVARTNLNKLVMIISDKPDLSNRAPDFMFMPRTIELSDLVMTENAFCAVVESAHGSHVTLIVRSITLTDQCNQIRYVNVPSGVFIIDIKHTNLNGIYFSFSKHVRIESYSQMQNKMEFGDVLKIMFLSNRIELNDLVMTENAFCAIVESANGINVTLIFHNITLTDQCNQDRYVKVSSGVSKTNIKHTNLNSIYFDYSVSSMRCLSLEDVTMTRKAFDAMTNALPPRLMVKSLSVDNTLGDDGTIVHIKEMEYTMQHGLHGSSDKN